MIVLTMLVILVSVLTLHKRISMILVSALILTVGVMRAGERAGLHLFVVRARARAVGWWRLVGCGGGWLVGSMVML